MSLHPTTPDFKENAHRALGDAELQKALGHVRQNFIDKRKAAAEEKDPDFDLVRGLFLKSAKIRCPCLKPNLPRIFSCRSYHIAV
jgi:hypothetical protein